MLAEAAGTLTLLNMQLDAERDSADRIVATLEALVRYVDEDALAVVLSPAVPWFTVGDLVEAELQRHRTLRAQLVEREQG